ncbi:MAG: type II secretion system F family protein [Actinobacteria bacterium]|nr:type II secretion system F family protein [Actinomycetota bacterium]
MYIAERRKDFINRIFRLQDNPGIEDHNKKSNIFNRINSWIRRNNLSWDVKEFFTVIFIIFTAASLAGLLIFKNFIASMLLSLFLVFLVFLAINIRSAREVSRKEIQFEQFLLDLTASLYGDPNILGAIENTINSTTPPLRWDLERVINDTKRGLLLKEALENMIDRNSSQVIRIILTGLITADEKGIDLIEYVGDQIVYIREKISLGNYIKILSSGPRYTAYLIMAIPVVVLAILIFINKGILNALFTGPGIAVMAYIVTSNVMGFCLINKIVNFHGGKGVIR